MENPNAFPQAGNSAWSMEPSPGMTLRDWFAGQALTGFIAAKASWTSDLDKVLAIASYMAADAMLAERARD